MAKSKPKNLMTRIIGNVMIILGIIVVWFTENSDAISGVLSTSQMVIAGLVVSAFNIILNEYNKRTEKSAKKVKRKTVDSTDNKQT